MSVPDDAVVTGVATYRERMALPDGAIFEATLEDVSRADAPATVVASTRVPAPPAPPINFSISYDPQRIAPTHRYIVRARIVHQDQLMFTTDTAHPVLTHGAPTNVEILLRRASSTLTSDASLENTYWKVMSIRGTPITVHNDQREPHFILHPHDQRVTGHGGCNAMTGGYETAGDRLTFKQMAGTMMACMNGMDQEQALHQALRDVARWEISGERLKLLDGQGTPVIELESRYLR
jgi:putative lipoprotein